jgi:DNA polymerase III epsilon subunit-like protein
MNSDVKKERYSAQKYILIDTETTGLDPRNNALIEIGAQVLTGTLELTETPPFHAHIKPHEGAVIDRRALIINKQHWVQDKESPEYKKALTPDAAWTAFTQFLKKNYETPSWIVLVGWNVGFDEEFLKGFYAHLHKKEPVVGLLPWPFHYHKIDLLGVVRYLDARTGHTRNSYKLEHVAQQYFGVAADFMMHTALGDSQMCIKVAHEVERGLLNSPKKKEE